MRRCVQLVPQIIKNYRRHGTDGLSAVMMFSWAIAAVPFGIYCIAQYLNIPLQIQPQLFLILCLATWGQCMYYDRHWTLRKCLIVILTICVLFAAIQVGVIFGIRVTPLNVYLNSLLDTDQQWSRLAGQDLWSARSGNDRCRSCSAIYRHLQRETCQRIQFHLSHDRYGGCVFLLALPLYFTIQYNFTYESVFEQFDPLAAAIYIVLDVYSFEADFRWFSSWRAESFCVTGTFF